jgi:hypothetical protein
VELRFIILQEAFAQDEAPQKHPVHLLSRSAIFIILLESLHHYPLELFMVMVSL